MESRWIERLLPGAGRAIVSAGLVLLVSLGGCGRSNDGAQRSMKASEAPSAEMATVETQESGAPASPVVARSVLAQPPTPAHVDAAGSRQEIIYSGDMTLEIDDVGKAVNEVTRMTRSAGGWISETTLITDGQGQPQTRLTLRIPAARFSSLHDSVKALGDVVAETIRSQDVGREFVDLEARLANFQREEEVVAALFKREGKIGDVLQVERELSRVRGEIEQIRGQLRFLRDQVSFSTLVVRLTPRRPALERKVASWNLGYHVLRAWRALVGLARLLTYAVIYGAIVVVPLGLVAWLIARGVLAARRRKPTP